jgi:hypothetical protein
MRRCRALHRYAAACGHSCATIVYRLVLNAFAKDCQRSGGITVCSRSWMPSSCSISWLRQTICGWTPCWSPEVRKCQRTREHAAVRMLVSLETLHIVMGLALKRNWCCAADIQLLNNHTILHARTAFVDWEVSVTSASWHCCYLLMC